MSIEYISNKEPVFVASDNHAFQRQLIRSVHIEEREGQLLGIVTFADVDNEFKARSIKIPSAEARQLIEQLKTLEIFPG